jgi:hypothetical protein
VVRLGQNWVKDKSQAAGIEAATEDHFDRKELLVGGKVIRCGFVMNRLGGVEQETEEVVGLVVLEEYYPEKKEPPESERDYYP